MADGGAAAYGGRVGVRRARRRGAAMVSVGRRVAAGRPRAMGARSLAGRTGLTQRIRPLRYVPERARVVQRLVRRGVLRGIAGGESARTRARNASRLARRSVAASHQGVA